MVSSRLKWWGIAMLPSVKVRLAIDLELPFEEQHLDSMRVHVYHDIAVPSVLQAFANTCVDG